MEFLEKLRSATNIVKVASEYTKLKKRGQKYIGLCPLHKEKDLSFTVDEKQQLFHCFGCGAGGDIFTLVMEKEKLSFMDAIKKLAVKFTIDKKETEDFIKNRSHNELFADLKEAYEAFYGGPKSLELKNIFESWVSEEIGDKRFIHFIQIFIKHHDRFLEAVDRVINEKNKF